MPSSFPPTSPADFSLVVLAAGPGYMVIDKPAGLSTHNDPEGDALFHAAEMLRADDELRHATRWQETFAPAPVHRLDKETSGCLCLATNKDMATRLQQAFESREECMKLYRAVLRGQLREPHGTWQNPLSDRAEGRRSPAGPAPEQRACETEYKVLRANAYFSDVRVNLLSGRQHQIRRHAVLNGHVVINDVRYGEPKHVDVMEKHYGISRMMLHAEQLEIDLEGGPLIEATAPLPPEFDALFPTAAGKK